MNPFRIAVLCGGPSGERGISLNSARSVCDHLDAAGADQEIEIVYLYYRNLDEAFPVERAQLYSNTPLDFDFKLGTTPPLDAEGQRAWLSTVNLVLPLLHGPIGEDGQIQRRLTAWGLPFWGSEAHACELAYPKHGADDLLRRAGFVVLPCWFVQADTFPANRDALLQELRVHQEGQGDLILKPRRGGSSLGVTAVAGPEEAMAAAERLLAEGHEELVIEPRIRGREFTVLVLESRSGEPVALLPTEIELRRSSVFSYQKKYLASEDVVLHTPPRFPDKIVEEIQGQAERLFALLSMRHFVRLDGWLLEDGRIAFTDINPISGMEQNSFLFQQTSRLGLSHRDTLRYLVERACATYDLTPPQLRELEGAPGRTPVAVLGGGVTTEREVSLLSATNVWLKLRASSRYAPSFFLLSTEDEVWSIPYTLCLAHTVREILDACRSWPELAPRNERFATAVRSRLGLADHELHAPLTPPQRCSLDAFLDAHPTVFLGLHGGLGEDGRIQAMLEARGAMYNGSGPAASALCIDKEATGRAIVALGEPGLTTLRKRVHSVADFLEDGTLAPHRVDQCWHTLLTELGGPSLIVKPVGDGCSAGVCRLDHLEHLHRYLELVLAKASEIPEGAMRPGEPAIRLPSTLESLLFEQFFVTDRLRVAAGKIELVDQGGWIEVTFGVLGPRGALRALTPSLTVAEGVVLSLEEKFQGGTGVNITPPPPELVSPEVLALARRRIEIAARTLGIEGYARLDAFLHRATGEVLLIEANTLPGLSPSTVIFHQALAESPPIFPRAFLEILLDLGAHRRESSRLLAEGLEDDMPDHLRIAESGTLLGAPLRQR
ncbi:MAG: hypothetical protein RMJ98_11535 [Myxococcales bacterium]|nr:hypothetical protein [Polyangiaceae bacterium]MDW8249920.1 hypothetical protein [Myxococcales bacterium]